MTAKFTIGVYDANTRTVDVTFRHHRITHKRSVNACHDDQGQYDAPATAIRVSEVALGVRNKIEAGHIRNQPRPRKPNN